MIVLIIHYFVLHLAKAHLHSALKSHEDAMKARQICRHCRKIAGLQKVNAFSLQGNTDCFWYINKMSVFILFSMLLIFLRLFKKLVYKPQTHWLPWKRRMTLKILWHPPLSKVSKTTWGFLQLIGSISSLIIIVNWTNKQIVYCQWHKGSAKSVLL